MSPEQNFQDRRQAADRRIAADSPALRRKCYCARRCVRVSTTSHDPSLRPRFAPGPFCFENCCYGRLSCRRLVGSLLDEYLLDAVTNLGVHRTPRRLCGRLNAAAQLVIKADIEPRWLLSIVRMHGHPIQCRGGTLGYDQITSRVRSGRLRRSATTATSALRYLRYLRAVANGQQRATSALRTIRRPHRTPRLSSKQSLKPPRQCSSSI